MPEIGKKFSRQREMIYKQVINHPTHPTADEVYSALKKTNPNLSLGTVYRNLNLLSEMGMLKMLRAGSGKERFDGRTDAHCHFFCTRCGRVFDIEDEKLRGLEERVEERCGHIIGEIEVSLRGVCADCLSSENN